MIRYAIITAFVLGLVGTANTDDRKPTMGQWVCYVPSPSVMTGNSGIYYSEKIYPKDRYEVRAYNGIVEIRDMKIDQVIVARYIGIQCLDEVLP